MKKRILGLVIGFLLIGFNAFAADGDLIVNGNVGIGPTSPQEKLSVEGNIRLNGVTSGYSDITFSRADGWNPAKMRQSYPGSGSAGDLSFWTSTVGGTLTEAMRILNTGNVGIGTTSPSHKLAVESAAYSAVPALTLRGYNNAQAYSVGDINFRTLTDTGTAITSRIRGVYDSNDYSGALTFYTKYSNTGGLTDETGLTERMRISLTGNVGIGTTSPGAILDVNGRIRVLNNTAPTSGAGLEMGYIPTGGDGSGAGIILTTDRSASTYKPMRYNALDQRFEISGVEKMRISSSGNVGIGNSNPGYLLTMEPGEGGGFYSAGPDPARGWHDSSSGRWKSDVRPIANALDTVLKLNGVSFKWKKRTDIYENDVDGTKKYISSSWADDPNGRQDIGLIGEDVVKVLPEVVGIDQKDTRFAAGVAYSKIVALLIEAIKEQQKAIGDLQAELETLKAR